MTKEEYKQYEKACDWYRNVNLNGVAGSSAMCYHCKSGLSFGQPYVVLHDRLRLGKNDDVASIFFHTNCFVEIAGTQYVLERK